MHYYGAMVFVRFLIDWRHAETALGRQMADIENNLPDLIVAEDVVPRRHSGRRDAVADDPPELAVPVFLHAVRGERWDRRRHIVRERDPGRLTVQAVADGTMMPKVTLPVADVRERRGKRIAILA